MTHLKSLLIGVGLIILLPQSKPQPRRPVWNYRFEEKLLTVMVQADCKGYDLPPRHFDLAISADGFHRVMPEIRYNHAAI